MSVRPTLRRRLGAFIIVLGLLGSLVAATPVLAASIVVNSTADSGADDGACTLREAITAANTDTASGATAGECAAGSGTDTITFSVAGTVTLASALPAISSNASIDGAGAITVSGAGATRVFNISAAGTVTLSGLTMTGGSAPVGGGILSSGALTIIDSTISGNTASAGGGGILSGGILTISDSTISGNTASAGGGGILGGGILTIIDSTISGNTASVGGGGVVMSASGTLVVMNSTISGNTAAEGGGISTRGTAAVTNSTISANAAGGGGGILNFSGSLTVTNSTISANTVSGSGGGIWGLSSETLINAIVAGNTAVSGPDVEGVMDTMTTSLIGVPGGLTLADLLDPAGLADNGGPTQTIALALVAGNPAIDTATGATCAAAPVSGLDQRGQPRPAACDIGAYEAQPPTVAAHANVSATATSASGAVVTFTAPAGTDEQGGAASVACLPASGSTFAVGSTTVTCTATDAVGHTGSGSFQVIVGAFVPPTTPTPTPTPTASPMAGPGQLPNTAAFGRSDGTFGRLAALALIGLIGLLGLAHPIRRSRIPSRRETARAGTDRRRG